MTQTIPIEPTDETSASKHVGPLDRIGGTREPGLYVVATPIGNLGDITLRAMAVLRQADIVACEDTRVARRLLSALDIAAPRLVSCHAHNELEAVPGLLATLKAGGRVALVADAGTPMVSDPGFVLVRACIEEGIAVHSVPGASSLLAALSVAGLPTDRFLFAGFLPAKAGARDRTIAGLADIDATLVFLESPRRLAATLAALSDNLGNRPAAVARELTKRYEEVRRDGLEALATRAAGEPAPRGEAVIVVGPPDASSRVGRAGARGDEADAIDVDSALRTAMADKSMRDAVRAVSAATGIPRKSVYRRALEIAAASAPE